MNQNNSGLDKMFGQLAEYKGFIIKFVALMFHDEMIPAEVGGKHIHFIEFWVLIFLTILLAISIVKIGVSIIRDIYEILISFRSINSQDD